MRPPRRRQDRSWPRRACGSSFGCRTWRCARSPRPGDYAGLRHHLIRPRLPIRDRRLHFGPVGEVAREGDDVAARPRHPRLGTDRMSPPPLASSNNQSPVLGPNAEVSVSASACANCHTVAISCAASFFVVFGPTPHSASTARSPITSIQFASVRVYTPAGFANPVATLARCLLSLIPTEHDKPVAEEMTVRTCSASSPGSSTSAPRYASSQPHPPADGPGRATVPSPALRLRHTPRGPTAGRSPLDSAGPRRATASPREHRIRELRTTRR